MGFLIGSAVGVGIIALCVAGIVLFAAIEELISKLRNGDDSAVIPLTCIAVILICGLVGAII